MSAPALDVVDPVAAHAALLGRYFHYHLDVMPAAYGSMDTNRVTLAYFALAGLDLLHQLQPFLDADNRRQSLIDWIYAHQVLPAADGDGRRCGFRGSTANCTASLFETSNGDKCGSPSQHPLDEANLSQTYTAIASLIICGDDLSRIDRRAIIGALHHLQDDSGNYRSCYSGGESDMRFVYCACAISALLGDWSGINVSKTLSFITQCQRYDGGFALVPDGEGHGGSTYLCVASLSLLNALQSYDRIDSLLHWCVMSQGFGYHGRPNKPTDTCYTFWIGAAIKLIDANHFTCPINNSNAVFECSDFRRGGFSKEPGLYPDLLHSYMAAAGLSLIHEMQRDYEAERGIDSDGDGTSNASESRMPSWLDWQLEAVDARVGITKRCKAAVALYTPTHTPTNNSNDSHQ